MRWKIIVLCAVLCGLVSGDVSEKRIKLNVEDLTDTSWFYYHKIGSVRLIEKSWILAFQLSVDVIDDRKVQVDNAYKDLQQICTDTQDNRICTLSEDFSNATVKEFHSRIDWFYADIGISDERANEESTNDPRIREVTVSGNSLGYDFDRISKHIAKNTTDVERMREHLLIIESSRDKYYKNIEKKYGNNSLQLTVSKLKDKMNKELDASDILLEINLIWDEINAIIDYFTEEIRGYYELSRYFINGAIVPGVFTAEELAELLEIMIAFDMPESFNFVGDPKQSESLMESAQISSYISREDITLVIKFPLINSVSLEINNVYPLPMRTEENEFQIIEPFRNHIIVNKSEKIYLPISYDEFERSIEIDSVYYLQTNQKIQKISKNSPCEIISYLGEPPEEPSCNKKNMKFESTITRCLPEGHGWLMVSPKKKQTQFECLGDKINKTIYSNSLVTSNSDCYPVFESYKSEKSPDKQPHPVSNETFFPRRSTSRTTRPLPPVPTFTPSSFDVAPFTTSHPRHTYAPPRYYDAQAAHYAPPLTFMHDAETKLVLVANYIYEVKQVIDQHHVEKKNSDPKPNDPSTQTNPLNYSLGSATFISSLISATLILTKYKMALQRFFRRVAQVSTAIDQALQSNQPRPDQQNTRV
ncbi:uncharacterized protein [Venturia canescens]|uniref:uncharacterized protein isoform X2 n=1 Tax=Venturia canescens TaxID=32260 RepID=UPI001C9C4438|nr:uncharacterized protein LOC122407278 isoform X2 [Venturia canescens]